MRRKGGIVGLWQIEEPPMINVRRDSNGSRWWSITVTGGVHGPYCSDSTEDQKDGPYACYHVGQGDLLDNSRTKSLAKNRRLSPKGGPTTLTTMMVLNI